jgi:hypothetical protein
MTLLVSSGFTIFLREDYFNMADFVKTSLEDFLGFSHSAPKNEQSEGNVIQGNFGGKKEPAEPIAQARLANTREGTLLFFRRVLPATGSFCYAYMKGGKFFTRAMVNNHEELLDGMNAYRNVDTWYSTASFRDTTSSEGCNVAELKSFRVDIEAGLAGHKTPSKYATDDEAVRSLFAFCDEIRIPYPGLLYSGHGVHGYWTLKATTTAETWQPYADGLKAAMKEWGLDSDPNVTADRARVLRAPGTFNCKEEPFVEVTLESRFFDVAELSLDDLKPLLKFAPVKKMGTPGVSAADGFNGSESKDAETVAYWTEVVMAIPNGPDDKVSRDDWFPVIAAIYELWGDCDLGVQLALKWSRQSPKFTGLKSLPKAWEGFGKYREEHLDNLRGLGTLVDRAKGAGWVFHAAPIGTDWLEGLDEVTPGSFASESTGGPSEAGGGPSVSLGGASGFGQWPEPELLPDGLLPVLPFKEEYLPTSIGPLVMDIADRMQCPVDFLGATAMAALGTVIGAGIAIRPEEKDNWSEVANLWTCIIGRSGILKSPAVQEALGPLARLEAEARENNKIIEREYFAEKKAWDLRIRSAEKAYTKNYEASGTACSDALGEEEPERPRPKKYIVQDSTYEKVGVHLANNDKGVMVHVDELISLLRKLDDGNHESDRDFYMTCWSGNKPYGFERIKEGRSLFIPHACISLLGTTQPGPISEYVQRALRGGKGDNGFTQRFALYIWPDASPTWKKATRYPDSDARDLAWATFQRLDKLTCESVGACPISEYVKIPYLRFTSEAQPVWDVWREKLEINLRSGELDPAFESHMGKYRGLVPALALINHLADVGSGPIGEEALLRALAFAEYLESHARRLYGVSVDPGLFPAKAILKKIKKRANYR